MSAQPSNGSQGSMFALTVSLHSPKGRGLKLRSFKNAMKDVGWHNDMQKEVWTFEDNDTWAMESFPPRKKGLGSK
ncbi:hypothetical protein J1N35_011486 [Gossypium stocksii]|uniref:Uncharacterized protein n=1 Tax=Gossypium stocksii TaxID=47602 RepID=A0A9D3W4B5_9ROSI|nr:hypothetical protein J1N35_011486 [Gossypium stocksii]